VGVVVGVGADGRVEVEFRTPVACRGCAGTCMWRGLPDAARATFASALPLRQGDAITLTLPERFLLAAAALVYGVPLLALLGGALAGSAATGTDLGAVAGAVLAVAGALLAVPRLRRRLEAATVDHLMLEPAAPDAHVDSL
jgi:sigma-E factor negative regulatory protein RseC